MTPGGRARLVREHDLSIGAGEFIGVSPQSGCGGAIFWDPLWRRS